MVLEEEESGRGVYQWCCGMEQCGISGPVGKGRVGWMGGCGTYGNGLGWDGGRMWWWWNDKGKATKLKEALVLVLVRVALQSPLVGFGNISISDKWTKLEGKYWYVLSIHRLWSLITGLYPMAVRIVLHKSKAIGKNTQDSGRCSYVNERQVYTQVESVILLALEPKSSSG